MKGVNGFVLFYSISDMLVFLTHYYVIAKQYGITVDCLCFMPNHVHEFSRCVSEKVLEGFHKTVCSVYAKLFNKEHGRKGQLFKKSYLSAAKFKNKSIKNAMLYVLDNPVDGKITTKAINYRWNFLAYKESDHPFSDKIDLRKASRKMRRAVKEIRVSHSEMRPLGYSFLHRIFKNLDTKEKKQLIDLIVSLYNPVDYSSLSNYYGDFSNALEMVDINSGSEHDINDERDDFSQYIKMSNAAYRAGYMPGYFKSMEREDIMRLMTVLASRTSATSVQIYKFLHIECHGKDSSS